MITCCIPLEWVIMLILLGSYIYSVNHLPLELLKADLSSIRTCLDDFIKRHDLTTAKRCDPGGWNSDSTHLQPKQSIDNPFPVKPVSVHFFTVARLLTAQRMNEQPF